MTDNRGLLRRYVEENSQAAFAELTERYLRLVFGTCLRELHDPVLAEDATQVVFLVLARKASGIRSETALACWLFTTARLTARQIRRREQIRVERERQAFEQSRPLDDGAVWARIADGINDAVAALGAHDREVVLLRFFDGLSLKEIGEMFGIPENTARMRVRRALGKLRKRLEPAGATLTIAALTAALTMEAAHALPAASNFAQRIAEASLPGITPMGAGAAAGGSGALTHSLQQTAVGVIKQMTIIKLRAALIAGAVGALCFSGAYTAVTHAAPKRNSIRHARPAATRGNTKERAAGATDPQGMRIIQRCQDAYASVTTFDETVTSRINDSMTATAHIAFQSPDKLRVTGSTLGMAMSPVQSYDMYTDRQSSRILLDGTKMDYPLPNSEVAIGGITGISGTAGTIIPGLLIHAQVSDLVAGVKGRPLTVSTEQIGGVSTYRLFSTQPSVDITYWIDRKTFYLVKMMEDSHDPKLHTVLTYDKPAVNQPIDPARFTP